MEFAIFPARVDGGRKIGEELRIAMHVGVGPTATEPIRTLPRWAVATRQSPAASVSPVFIPVIPGKPDRSRGLLLYR